VSALRGKRLVHVTTVDMSLVLLLGRQLRAFADAGMDVIGVSAVGPYVPELESWGIRHIPLRHATRSAAAGQDILAFLELRRLLQRIRPDIVHTHNPKPGLYGRLAARTVGVPGVVNTVHGLYATPDDHALTRGVVYSLERLASLCSSAELVQNVEDFSLLGRIGVPRDKLVLLGNGVDLERFRPRATPSQRRNARSELGVRGEAVVVGVVARLVWQKGFRELFAVAELLRDRCPNIQFVVVGDTDRDKSDAIGPGERALAQRRGRIVFAGARDRMEEVYRAFDLFVLPSHREGFPRSAMEAAASGLPVIATDIRGCREVVTHGVSGLLVPLRDPPRLAAAVEELGSDAGLRRRMGEAGRRKAEAEFDDRTVIAKTLQVYERVLDPDRDSKRRRTPWSAARPS
jgi:glycosyltransferase involved in cell wall biosynthesis